MNNDRLNVLICGSGAAAVLYAVLLKRFIPDASFSFVCRASGRNIALQEQYQNGELTFRLECAHLELERYRGFVTPDQFVTEFKMLRGEFDLVILATPVFLYHEFLDELLSAGNVSPTADVLAVSGYLGTGAVISRLIESFSKQVGLVLLGDLIAIASKQDGEESTFVVSASKSYVRYHQSDAVSSQITSFLEGIVATLVPELTHFSEIWEVAQGNTNLFHVPLTVHESLADRYFDPQSKESFLYAPYPAGAMSWEVSLNSAQLEEELHRVYSSLGLPEINFLRFRLDRGCLQSPFLSAEMVESYNQKSRSERAGLYLLYSWLAERRRMNMESLEGDQASKCSLSHFPRVRVRKGSGVLPRIPVEDYACLKGILEFAKQISLDLPMIASLCEMFERFCSEKPAQFGYELDFDSALFESVAKRYSKELIARNKQ